MIGKILAHYEITSLLGRGGMGEVYKAKDQKLGRDVAIKVLPQEFARDTDRVARFQREAKLLASLNHPNIASIYGLEESDGTHFLVLELIEGDTLGDRIKTGPIPVEESLKLAQQIAEALEAAHEKGVIHRDLKPSNIKVTPEGKVKVLDFGLAKAYAGEREDMILSDSPTISAAATQKGVILGTAAYMSPEQARGKSVDKRADIWAFGVVLFEMLTGRSLFAGDDVSQTLARVLEREPDFSVLPLDLHPRIRLLLERCLEKAARNRYGSINDARVDIEKALADPSGVLVQAVARVDSRRMLRAILPWAAAALVLGLIIAGVAVWNLRTPESRPVMRFDYDLPEGQQLSSSGLPSLAVSPDGKQFVYSTTNGLYLRSADELTAKLIAGTEGGTQQPFFSPDGKWIGYFSPNDRQLKKIAVNGGVPVALCQVDQLVGARWNEDNTIVYGQYPPSPIMLVSANGGTPEDLIKPKPETPLLIFPQILPDGKSVLFTAQSAAISKPRVMVQSLKTGEEKELFAGTLAQYLPTGHIVYQLPNSNNLFAAPFDLDNLEITGGSVPIIEGAESADFSKSGTLIYIPQPTIGAGPMGASAPGNTLVWVDRQGKEDPLAANPNQYWYFRISPDGKRVALSVASASKRDIWVLDVVRETLTRLTFDEGQKLAPIWTPDGKRIVYAVISVQPMRICWKAADGTGTVETLVSAPDRSLAPYSWSKDGKILVLAELSLAPLQMDIAALSMEGDRERKQLLHEDYDEDYPLISPDGRWMAYQSNESGRYEVYVRPFPDVDRGGKWQISTEGGDSPLWSPNGSELFYRSGESFMAVGVETEPTFNPGKPKVLFKGSYLSAEVPLDHTIWDIHPNGKKFLMIKPPVAAGEAEAPRKIIIVTNWIEELKRRVPGK
jgi:serine/threonine protein kinase